MVRSKDFTKIFVRETGNTDNFQPKCVHQIYELEQQWQISRHLVTCHDPMKKLNSCVIDDANSAAHSFRILGEIASGPFALFTWMERRTL